MPTGVFPRATAEQKEQTCEVYVLPPEAWGPRTRFTVKAVRPPHITVTPKVTENGQHLEVCGGVAGVRYRVTVSDEEYFDVRVTK